MNNSHFNSKSMYISLKIESRYSMAQICQNAETYNVNRAVRFPMDRGMGPCSLLWLMFLPSHQKTLQYSQ